MSDDLPQYESLEEVSEVAKESGRKLRKFFDGAGKMYPDDDWERELSEEEFSRRFMRVSGNVVCHICGEEYWRHPDETRILGMEDRPFTKRLCNGWFGKL